MNYPPHPYAELFPIMSGADMTEFVADLKRHGLRTPIVLFEGKILDGRHRYEGCQLAGIEPRFKEYDGDDALGFVLSENLQRRHLSAGQRAMLADKIATMKRSHNQHTLKKHTETPTKTHNEVSGIPLTSQKTAAQQVGASVDSVKVAHKISTASPALAKQVERGEISLHAAEKKLAASKPAPTEDVLRDEVGQKIPAHLVELWQRGEESRAMQRVISGWRRLLHKAKETNDPLFKHVSHGSWEEGCGMLFCQFEAAIPYAVCPACHALKRPACQQCKGTGFVSKHLWQHTVPKEMKDLIALKKD